MNRTVLITVGVIVGILVLLGLWYAGTYNSLVTSDESVDAAWADVETQLQRRLDLIPNLVATVQGAADFEQETQTEIANLRTQAQQAQQDFASAGSIQAQQQAAAAGESVLTRFMLVVENYPQLRATANFQDLQTQLEGTENRISVARQRYNEQARAYNTRVRTVPTSIVANMAGFEQKPYFEADAGAENAPQVEFD